MNREPWLGGIIASSCSLASPSFHLNNMLTSMQLLRSIPGSIPPTSCAATALTSTSLMSRTCFQLTWIRRFFSPAQCIGTSLMQDALQFYELGLAVDKSLGH